MTAEEVMALIRASDKAFYCYILRRPDGRPFYVGIGKRYRVLQHLSDARRQEKGWRSSLIRKMLAQDKHPIYEIAGFFACRDDAAAEEKRLIRLWGRADLRVGVLVNLTDGGEGAPGASPSIETREKMAQSRHGRIVGAGTRQKLREARNGFRLSAEAIERSAAKQRGVKRGPRSEATKELLRAAFKGRVFSEDQLERMRQSQRRRAERVRGIPIPHHKNSTPAGRLKFCRPVSVNGIIYPGIEHAARALGIGRTTLKRWLKIGKNGARRLSGVASAYPVPDPA